MTWATGSSSRRFGVGKGGGDGADRGALQDAGPVPLALGADQHVGVGGEREGIRVRLGLEQHLGVAEVAEGERPFRLDRARAEALPERHEAILRVAVDLAVALDAAELDAGPHEIEGEARAAELAPNREPLELGEIGEEAGPDAAGRLVVEGAEEVDPAEIVSVELFAEGAILLGHVDGGPKRDDLHEVVQRARHLDALLRLVRARLARLDGLELRRGAKAGFLVHAWSAFRVRGIASPANAAVEVWRTGFDGP